MISTNINTPRLYRVEWDLKTSHKMQSFQGYDEKLLWAIAYDAYKRNAEHINGFTIA